MSLLDSILGSQKKASDNIAGDKTPFYNGPASAYGHLDKISQAVAQQNAYGAVAQQTVVTPYWNADTAKEYGSAWDESFVVEARIFKAENGYVLRIRVPPGTAKSYLCATHTEVGEMLTTQLVLNKMEGP